MENNLRHKVRLQIDGGLKTGLDIIKAAILGAESFGFGTGPMVALGCRYLRICHLNNCIAQDVREILASLGVEKLTDLIGRTDLLELVEG